jgi:adenylosuccinate synthase
VGNVEGHSSGSWYLDQVETSWDVLGIQPELTTVTKRQRRIATWSWMQFRDAMRVNRPTHVFLNFMNYLKIDEAARFVDEHVRIREESNERYDFIYGHGPRTNDIYPYSDPTQLYALRE